MQTKRNELQIKQNLWLTQLAVLSGSPALSVQLLAALVSVFAVRCLVVCPGLQHQKVL